MASPAHFRLRETFRGHGAAAACRDEPLNGDMLVIAGASTTRYVKAHVSTRSFFLFQSVLLTPPHPAFPRPLPRPRPAPPGSAAGHGGGAGANCNSSGNGGGRAQMGTHAQSRSGGGGARGCGYPRGLTGAWPDSQTGAWPELTEAWLELQRAAWPESTGAWPESISKILPDNGRIAITK